MDSYNVLNYLHVFNQGTKNKKNKNDNKNAPCLPNPLKKIEGKIYLKICLRGLKAVTSRCLNKYNYIYGENILQMQIYYGNQRTTDYVGAVIDIFQK